MCRCASCNAIMYNNSGWITLPDGTKVEENLCPRCRVEVRKAMSIDITKPDSLSDKVLFKDIIEQQIKYGAVTPSKKVPY